MNEKLLSTNMRKISETEKRSDVYGTDKGEDLTARDTSGLHITGDAHGTGHWRDSTGTYRG